MTLEDLMTEAEKLGYAVVPKTPDSSIRGKFVGEESWDDGWWYDGMLPKHFDEAYVRMISRN